MEKLRSRYESQVEFLGVYIREAHPTDGWRMASNDRAGIQFAQPKTLEARIGIATVCQSALHLEMPLVVDSLDDTVEVAYGAFPDRLYVIDPQGRVAFKSGRGPFGYEPDKLERSLVMLLMDQQQAKRSANTDDKPQTSTEDSKRNKPDKREPQDPPSP